MFDDDEDRGAGPFGPAAVTEAFEQAPLDSGDLSTVLTALGVPDDVDLDLEGGESMGVIRVPAQVAGKVAVALARLRAQMTRSVTLDFALEIQQKDGTMTMLSARESIPVGETTVFADAREKPYLADHDVEIAEASEIPDPIAWYQRTGASLSVRVRTIAGAGAAIVEARARVDEHLDLPPIDLKHPDFGPLDRGGVGIEELSAAFRVEPGKVSEHVWTGRAGRRVRLRLKIDWNRPRPDSGIGTVLWVPLRGVAVQGFRHVPWTGRAAGEETDEDWPGTGTVEYVEVDFDTRMSRAMEGKMADLAHETESGLLVFEGEHADAARDELVAQLSRALPAHRVEILCLDVPAGMAVDTTGKIPEGGREVLRASGTLVPHLNACFAGSEEQNFVLDWDVEVAQAALIPDPIVQKVASGHFLNVRLVPGEGEKPASVLLDLQLLRLEDIESKVMPIKIPRGRVRVTGTNTAKGGTTSGTIIDPSQPPPERAEYVLERPVLREMRVSSVLPLDKDGQAWLRRSARGILGPTRELVILVTVR
jgi:hypothetical protein